MTFDCLNNNVEKLGTGMLAPLSRPLAQRVVLAQCPQGLPSASAAWLCFLPSGAHACRAEGVWNRCAL